MAIPRKSFSVRRQNRNRVLTICCLLLLCTSGILAYCYHRERNTVSEIQNERNVLANNAKILESNYRELKEEHEAFKKSNLQNNSEYNSLKQNYDALRKKYADMSIRISAIIPGFTKFFSIKVEHDNRISSLNKEKVSILTNIIEKYAAALSLYNATLANSIIVSFEPDIEKISLETDNISNEAKRFNEEIEKFLESIGYLNEVLEKFSQP